MRFITFIFICFCSIVACAPHTFFISSNYMKKVKGIIYMKDGTAKDGLITISFENLKASDNEFTFISDSVGVAENLDIRKVKSYSVNNRTYVPKIIDVHLSKENHYLFVERLTGENDKMQLYKLQPSENTTLNGEEPFYYYISFPSFAEYDVIDINSSKLVLLFDIKMGNYIVDCPELLTKIQSKDKNYYYTLLSLGYKRIEVIKNIVQQYNNCK